MPRSLSERVYLRNNVFATQNTNQSNGAPSPQKAPPAAAKETLNLDAEDQMPNVKKYQKANNTAAEGRDKAKEIEAKHREKQMSAA